MLRVFKTYHTGSFTVMFSSYPGLLSSTGAAAHTRTRVHRGTAVDSRCRVPVLSVCVRRHLPGSQHHYWRPVIGQVAACASQLTVCVPTPPSLSVCPCQTSTGLVVAETTNLIYNNSLYDLVHPTNSVMSWARVGES